MYVRGTDACQHANFSHTQINIIAVSYTTQHKTKIGETIFLDWDVCMSNWEYFCTHPESEVNLCMQHNEANAIIYKPVGDMDFARYSFCISLTLSPMHIIHTFNNHPPLQKSIFTKNIIWKLQLVPLTHYVELYSHSRVGIKLNSRRTRLWISYRDCHTEKKKKSLPFEHHKEKFFMWCVQD